VIIRAKDFCSSRMREGFPCIDEFNDYDLAKFSHEFKKTLKQVIEEVFLNQGFEVNDHDFDVLQKFIYVCIISKEDFSGFTGLIFVGYGDDEVYPSLHPINISIAIGNKIRYYQADGGASISTSQFSAVCPFAQTDVINTILTGIDPMLDDVYSRNFEKFLDKYNELILEKIGSDHPLLETQIVNIDRNEITTALIRLNEETRRQRYIYPLLIAINTLSKGDLAEMAESLVYLTYLKRRFTFAEEGVGGPVDVAIISKGDGFIWIKRKHYFKPELNQHFLKNYFNV